MNLNNKLEVESHKKNEFSRDLVIQEEKLDTLRARAQTFYDNFDEEFCRFEAKFKTNFSLILRQLVKSKLEF